MRNERSGQRQSEPLDARRRYSLISSRHETRRPAKLVLGTGVFCVSCWLSAVVTMVTTLPPGSMMTLIPTASELAILTLAMLSVAPGTYEPVA